MLVELQGPWAHAMESVIRVPRAPSRGTAVVRAAEPRAGAGAAPHSELWTQKLWGGEQAPVSFFKPLRWSLLCPRLRNSGLEAQKWVGSGVKKAEVVRAEGPWQEAPPTLPGAQWVRYRAARQPALWDSGTLAKPGCSARLYAPGLR